MLAQTQKPGNECIVAKLRDYFALEEELAAAYLFGSRAAGSFRPDSDVDVAVIFPAGLETEPAFWERVRIMNDLEDLLKPLRVDVLDLERVPPRIAHEILRSAVLLFERNLERRVLVEAARQSEYLDFLPRLRYYRKEVLGLDG